MISDRVMPLELRPFDYNVMLYSTTAWQQKYSVTLYSTNTMATDHFTRSNVVYNVH